MNTTLTITPIKEDHGYSTIGFSPIMLKWCVKIAPIGRRPITRKFSDGDKAWRFFNRKSAKYGIE